VTEVLEKAQEYYDYVYVKCNAHFAASERAKGRNLWLGVPATVFATIVGTTVFASLTHETSVVIVVAVGMLSVGAAVLSALQTFFKFSEVAEKYRLAGAAYESLMHRLDLFRLTYAGGAALRDSAIADLKEIAASMDSLARTSPSIPHSIYDDVEKSLLGHSS
jgi:hypothetical protein